MVSRLSIALLAIVLATPAMAQPQKNTHVGSTVVIPPAPAASDLPPETRKQLQLGATVDILQLIHDDAKAAFQDADANKDVLATACYSAVVIVTEAKMASQQMPGGGLLFAFQKLRDITRLNASPLGLTLISGCAALAQDAKVNLIQLFTSFGAAILLKGVLL